MKIETKETYMKPDEVASLLRLHINTVYRQLKSGKIKSEKWGKSWRIPAAQFDKG